MYPIAVTHGQGKQICLNKKFLVPQKAKVNQEVLLLVFVSITSAFAVRIMLRTTQSGSLNRTT